MTLKTLSFELNNWLSSLGGGLCRLQRDQKLCDVRIQTKQGTNIYVHSSVIAAGSSVLMKTLINQTNTGYKTHILTIRSDFEECVWEAVVAFLYTGKLHIDTVLLPQLLKLTKILRIDELSSILKSAENKVNCNESIVLTCVQPGDVSSLDSSGSHADETPIVTKNVTIVSSGKFSNKENIGENGGKISNGSKEQFSLGENRSENMETGVEGNGTQNQAGDNYGDDEVPIPQHVESPSQGQSLMQGQIEGERSRQGQCGQHLIQRQISRADISQCNDHESQNNESHTIKHGESQDKDSIITTSQNVGNRDQVESEQFNHGDSIENQAPNSDMIQKITLVLHTNDNFPNQSQTETDSLIGSRIYESVTDTNELPSSDKTLSSDLCTNSDEPPLITNSIFKCALCSLTFQSFQSLVLHSDLCQNLDMGSDIDEDERNELITEFGFPKTTKVIFEDSVSVKAIEIPQQSSNKLTQVNSNSNSNRDTDDHCVTSMRENSPESLISDENKSVDTKNDIADHRVIPNNHETYTNGNDLVKEIGNSITEVFDNLSEETDDFLQELQSHSEREDRDFDSSSSAEINDEGKSDLSPTLNKKTKRRNRKNNSPQKRKAKSSLEKENVKSRKTTNADKKDNNIKETVESGLDKIANFCCEICGVGLSSKMTLQEHMNLHSEEETYQCDKCLKTFQTKRYLYRHQKFVHVKKVKNHACDLCDKTFQVKSHLTTHVKYDHCEDPDSQALNRCDLCNKTFRYPILLKQHLLIHSNDLQFTCSLCNKSFLTKHYLERHMLTHVDIQPWTCQKCDKKFKYKSSLAHHQQTTCSLSEKTEVISYPCDICKRVFNEKKNLTAHVKQVHLGVKQFMCKICNRSFSRNSTLKSHIYNIHEREERKDKNNHSSNQPLHPPIPATIKIGDTVAKPGIFDDKTFLSKVVKQEMIMDNVELEEPSEPVRNIVNKFVKIQPKPEAQQLAIITTTAGNQLSGEMSRVDSFVQSHLKQEQQMYDQIIEENQYPGNAVTEVAVVTESSQLLASDTQDDKSNLIKPMTIKLSGIVPLSEKINIQDSNRVSEGCLQISNITSIPANQHSESVSGANNLVSSVNGGLSVTSAMVSNQPGLQFVNSPQTTSMDYAADQMCEINLPQITNVNIVDDGMEIQQPLNLSIAQNPLSIATQPQTTANINFNQQNHLNIPQSISQISIAHITHTQPIFVKSLSSSSVVITNTGPPTKDFDENPDDTERNELYFVDQSSADLSILNGPEIGSDDSYVKNKLDYSLFSLSGLGKTPDKL